MSDLHSLYHPDILEQNDHPFHFEKRDDAAIIIEAYNPVCGDQFHLYLDVENDIISSASFYGYGCAVSKASSSMLIKWIIGKNKNEVSKIVSEYLDWIRDGSDLNYPFEDESLKVFGAARNFPGRIQCADLSWSALYSKLN